jgi:hypothetical protein
MDREERKGKIKIVNFFERSKGPPEIEVPEGNSKRYAKCRLI